MIWHQENSPCGLDYRKYQVKSSKSYQHHFHNNPP